MAKDTQESIKRCTRDELKAYLADIEEKVIGSGSAYLHSVVALDEMLRLPDAVALLDEELKSQIRDLWIKLRSTGAQLSEPPILFGLPADFEEQESEVFESEDVAELGEKESQEEAVAKSSKKEKPGLPEGGPEEGTLIS